MFCIFLYHRNVTEVTAKGWKPFLTPDKMGKHARTHLLALCPGLPG